MGSADPSAPWRSPALSSRRSVDEPGPFLVQIQSRRVIPQSLTRLAEAASLLFRGTGLRLRLSICTFSPVNTHCSGYLPQLPGFIWLFLAFVALQVQTYTVKVRLCCGNTLLAGMGSFKQIPLLLEKHEFIFWKGTRTLLPGGRCQGVIGGV